MQPGIATITGNWSPRCRPMAHAADVAGVVTPGQEASEHGLLQRLAFAEELVLSARAKLSTRSGGSTR